MENAGTREHVLSPIVVKTPCRRPGTALQYAAREAALHGCGLRLVHAYAPDEAGQGAVGTAAQADAAEVLAAEIAQAKAIVGPDIDLTGLLVYGPPVAAVIDASPDARLVVLEHHDVLNLLLALARPTGGGTAPHAYVPIAVVPDGWTPSGIGSRPVTVGVEFPQDSQLLLRRAVSVARAHRTWLRVVHAWTLSKPDDDLVVGRVRAEMASRLRAEIEAALDGCHRAEPAVTVHFEIRHDQAVDALRVAATDSELLVLGRNDPCTRSGSRMGRVPRTFLHESPCPVVLLSPLRRHAGAQTRQVAGDPVEIPS